MLKQRLITAALLLPLVILGVLYLPNDYFTLVLVLVVLLGADEMARLGGLQGLGLRLGYVLAIGLLLVVLAALQEDPLFPLLFGMAALWWVTVSTLFLLGRWHPRPYQGVAVGALFAGGLILGMAWLALGLLHAWGEHGPALVLFLLVLIWTADSGAYFAGRRWGRTKLAPSISPGKTREGVYGALAGSLVCAGVLHYLQLLDISFGALIAICLATTLISVGGDLWESLIKRQRGIKDSGNLLPGHGGVLDRIDSLLSAAPFFLFLLMLLEPAA